MLFDLLAMELEIVGVLARLLGMDQCCEKMEFRYFKEGRRRPFQLLSLFGGFEGESHLATPIAGLKFPNPVPTRRNFETGIAY